MRLRIALIFGLVMALAVGAVSLTQAASAFKVTGGGQTDVDTTARPAGAGDTIAFTARNVDGSDFDAEGQVQYIDREGGTGRVQTVYHGTVTCLVAVSKGEDGAAYLAGQWERPAPGPFEMYVEDNGEPNQGRDLIFIDQNEPADCSDEDDEEDRPAALARGNVQVHAEE